MNMQYCYLVPKRKLSCVSHRLNRMGLPFRWERAGVEEIALIVSNVTETTYKEIRNRLHICD